MKDIIEIEGGLVAGEGTFGVVVSRFNAIVGERLLAGAVHELRRHGVAAARIRVVHVPGAFELPVTAKTMAQSGQYAALIALGVVIRGGTPHFDFVAGACVNGLNQVALESKVPVALGVLTVDSLEQAMDRAGAKAGNKGTEAALCALEMADLLRRLRSP